MLLLVQIISLLQCEGWPHHLCTYSIELHTIIIFMTSGAIVAEL